MLFHGGEAYIHTHFLVMKMQAVYWVRTRHFWRKVWLQLTLGSACVPMDTTPNIRVYHQLPPHFLWIFSMFLILYPLQEKLSQSLMCVLLMFFFPSLTPGLLWMYSFVTEVYWYFYEKYLRNQSALDSNFQSWFPVSIVEFKQHYIMQFRKISWWIWPNGQFPCDYILNLWRGHSYTSNCVHKL